MGAENQYLFIFIIAIHTINDRNYKFIIGKFRKGNHCFTTFNT